MMNAPFTAKNAVYARTRCGSNHLEDDHEHENEKAFDLPLTALTSLSISLPGPSDEQGREAWRRYLSRPQVPRSCAQSNSPPRQRQPMLPLLRLAPDWKCRIRQQLEEQNSVGFFPPGRRSNRTKFSVLRLHIPGKHNR